MRISKVNAFNLIAVALEANDEQAASKLLQIISKYINKSKNAVLIASYIEINDKKDINVIRQISNAYGKDLLQNEEI